MAILSGPIVTPGRSQGGRLVTTTHPELRLTGTEFDACWELLGLPERPTALELPSPGRTHRERRRVLAGVLAGLCRRGLARPGQTRPHPVIAEHLGLLARPRYEIDLRLGGGRVALGAVGADGRGVVAAKQGDQVWTVGMRAGEVVPRLVGLIGPMRPGVIRPVNIPADALDEALRAAGPRRSVWAVADELAVRGVPRADAAALAHSFSEVRDIGQLAVTGIVEGRRHDGPWALGFHLGGSGWIGTVRRASPSGTAVSVFPLDSSRAAARLTQLVDHTR
jgi:hypothetical protein